MYFCHLWHVPHNVNHPTGDELQDTCKKCRLLHHDITKLIMEADSAPERKLARIPITIMKYLSPASRIERVSKLSKDRKNLASKLSYIRGLEYNLKDKQHAELLEKNSEVSTLESQGVMSLKSCVWKENVYLIRRPILSGKYGDKMYWKDFNTIKIKGGTVTNILSTKSCWFVITFNLF